MARTRTTTDVITRKKPKLLPGQTYMKTANKIVDEYLIPRSAADVAGYLFPYGKAGKAVVKGAKAIARSKKAKTVIKAGVVLGAAKTTKKTTRSTNKLNKKIKP